MTIFGYLTLFSLPLVVLFFFAAMPARKAVIASFLWGWLFLPMKAYAVHGLSEYSKLSATALSVLLATFIFDFNRILAFRPKIWDLPILAYLFAPFISSIHNGLGAYDGANAAMNQFHLWIGGYIVGRLYFTDLEGLRELAFGFILGGLLYAPLCLYESRMSPQLHQKIYGFLQHDFSQTRRLGGYRPVVFMQHGIAVGSWMMASALTAWWMWWTGAFARRWKLSAWFCVLVLVGTFFICRAAEAMVLLAMGIGLLAFIKRVPWRIAIVALMLITPVYTYARAKQIWTGDTLVNFAAHISQDRANSLAFRERNEDLLIGRALESPMYGWAGWNRFEVLGANGKPIAVPDQQWIIAFGKTGAFGLVALELSLLAPLFVLMWRVPVRYWSHPSVAPAAVLAVIVALHLIDCMFNAMVNPIFMMAAGGVTGMLPVKITTVNRQHRGMRSAGPGISSRAFAPNSPGIGQAGMGRPALSRPTLSRSRSLA